MATEQEILDDIANIYKKIEQCYASKEELTQQIQKENEDIIGLKAFIDEDVVRLSQNKRLRYDAQSMKDNIERCKSNIALFKDTISKEDASIKKFHDVIGVLRDDMKRPKEIIIDAGKLKE
jgi:hypothetical protein